MVRNVLKEKPIPLGQVNELLMIREQAGINYVQRVTAQHAEKLSRDAAYSEEVLEALEAEPFNLPRILAVQLVNINPKTHVDVRGVIGSDRLSEDDIERLLEIYKDFAAKAAAKAKAAREGEGEAGPEDIEEGFDDL